MCHVIRPERRPFAKVFIDHVGPFQKASGKIQEDPILHRLHGRLPLGDIYEARQLVNICQQSRH